MTNTLDIPGVTTNFLHGGQVLSATIQYGRVIVFDRPPHNAGAPGTVTADEAADWTAEDWQRLAKSRQRALRRRQRAAGMRPPRPKKSSPRQHSRYVARNGSAATIDHLTRDADDQWVLCCTWVETGAEGSGVRTAFPQAGLRRIARDADMAAYQHLMGWEESRARGEVSFES